MLPYPSIDPIIISIGPVAIRWYGLMYALGFLCCYLYIRRRIRQGTESITREHLADLLLVVFFGVLLGGRLGYVLFYNLGYFLSEPAKILALWDGGMSFHGGLLGVIIAISLYCWFKKLPPMAVADTVVTPIPIALGLGRLGNFINGELYGKASDLPWCMVFPSGGDICRHPSQLYELAAEGILLFLLLWLMERARTPRGSRFWAFLLSYGLIRFGIEFFREPDTHLGYLWAGITMGQLLSLPLILIGGIMLCITLFSKKTTT